MKHLWLRPHPTLVSKNPDCWNTWNVPEAHLTCTAATCLWVTAQLTPIVTDDDLVLTGADIVMCRNTPPASVQLLPAWEDPPAVIPWDWGNDKDNQEQAEIQDYRWYTSLMSPADVVRTGAVTLCGQLMSFDEGCNAARRSDATCLDCLHKLEIDQELSMCPVVPFEHAYLACRAEPGKATQRSVGTECRRCSGSTNAWKAIL